MGGLSGGAGGLATSGSGAPSESESGAAGGAGGSPNHDGIKGVPPLGPPYAVEVPISDLLSMV